MSDVVKRKSRNHVPNAGDFFGTMDTSDTGGAKQDQLAYATPIFEVDRARSLQLAARALDPEDPGVPLSAVNLAPEMASLPEDNKQRILAAARKLKKDPIEIKDPTAAKAEEVAEENTPPAEKAARVEQEQEITDQVGVSEQKLIDLDKEAEDEGKVGAGPEAPSSQTPKKPQPRPSKSS